MNAAEDTDLCACGHGRDEHPKHSGFTSCFVDDCKCVAFEYAGDETEAEEEEDPRC